MSLRAFVSSAAYDQLRPRASQQGGLRWPCPPKFFQTVFLRLTRTHEVFSLRTFIAKWSCAIIIYNFPLSRPLPIPVLLLDSARCSPRLSRAEDAPVGNYTSTCTVHADYRGGRHAWSNTWKSKLTDKRHDVSALDHARTGRYGIRQKHNRGMYKRAVVCVYRRASIEPELC